MEENLLTCHLNHTIMLRLDSTSYMKIFITVNRHTWFMQKWKFHTTYSPNGLFQFISVSPPVEEPHFLPLPWNFQQHFYSIPWNFQHYLPPSHGIFITIYCLPWNFQHFVSIFNPLLGISSPKMPSPMGFFGFSTGGGVRI